MADVELMSLLREMRDLQQLHVDNYKAALRNQEEAILLQKQVVRRQRIALVFLLFVVVVGFLALLIPEFAKHY